MRSRVRTYLRRNHLEIIAAFIALSGTAYAVDGPLSGQNTVGSEDIINREVREADLGTGGVRSGKIKDGAVGTSEVANDTTPRALTGADIAAGGLSGADIHGLTGGDFKSNSLTGADTQDDSVISSDLSGLWGPDVIRNGLTGADIKGITGADIRDGSLDHGDLEDLYHVMRKVYVQEESAGYYNLPWVQALCQEGDIAVTGGSSWGNVGGEESPYAYDYLPSPPYGDRPPVLASSRPVNYPEDVNNQPRGWFVTGDWSYTWGDGYLYAHVFCMRR